MHVLLEGQTEENVFVEVLEPYLSDRGFDSTYSIIVTKRPTGRAAHRGGVSSWTRIAKEVHRLLANSHFDVVTTLFDYYGFPTDAPGMVDRRGTSSLDRVRHVESSLAAAIGSRRFLPHLVLHEIETWVFAASDQLGELRGNPQLAAELHRMSRDAGGPELINDGPATAPSKRIQRIFPDYDKTFDGPLAVAALGIDALRAQCPHADEWLRKLGV